MRLPAAPRQDGAVADAPAATSLSGSDAYAQFRSDFDAGRYEAATPYARRVLEVAEKQAKSPADEEVQVALMNLAMTQYLAGNYVDSEASYTRAIALIEASGRPLQARLARAHAGLAATYHAGQRHDLAVKEFEQAVSLTRRQEGLLSEAQVPLVEQFIDSLTELGKYQEALQAHRYLLRIAARKSGTNSPDYAPALERVSRWLARIGVYDQARLNLHRAIELIEAGDGANSVKLISPLAALAQCNARQLTDPNQAAFASADDERARAFQDPGMVGPSTVSPAALTGEGERALQRAADIADRHPDLSPVQVADVRTQLGDWYQSRGSAVQALPHYQRAWAAAARAERKVDGKPLTEALFGQPVLLRIERPDHWDRYSSRPPDQTEVRNVVLEFTVTAEGRPLRPKVLEDSGDAKRADRVEESLESARYRPRFENGQPIATERVTFTQPWILLLPGVDSTTPAKPTPATGAGGEERSRR
jgi:tetratricopeptide (TPR) repeat protein